MDIDPLFLHQWSVDTIDDFSSIASAFTEGFHYTSQQPQLEFKRPGEAAPVGENRPLKQLKTSNWMKPAENTMCPNTSPIVGVVKPKEEAWYSPTTLNFPAESIVVNQNYVLKPCQGVKRVAHNNKLAQAQDHILAERKRREKLSQRFIALSALVPGLKKVCICNIYNFISLDKYFPCHN